jgi:4-hydroxy-tetrahydrodipicolinate synthase
LAQIRALTRSANGIRKRFASHSFDFNAINVESCASRRYNGAKISILEIWEATMKLLDAAEAKELLTGPVPSFCTPFLEDGAIDYKGVGGIVDFLVSAGARTILLTFGDSLLSLLSDQEVGAVTRAVLSETAGRAAVIACGKQWWLGQALEFAAFCRDAGADILIPISPDWAQSAGEEGMIRLYRGCGAIMPVMALTSLMSGRGIPLAVFRRLLEEDSGFVAIKDDMPPPYGRRLCALVKGRWPVLSGGCMENHLDVAPYGSDGYLPVFTRFAPAVDEAYWRCYQQGDLAGCAGLVARYEEPFFALCETHGISFSCAIQGMMHLTGQCGPWRRMPYTSAMPEQLEILAGFLKCLPGSAL